MGDPFEIAAFRRGLGRSELEAAIRAWDVFASLKGLLGMLFAASTLAVCGRLSDTEYRKLVEHVVGGTMTALNQLRDIRFQSDDERLAFGDALLAFVRELKAHVLAPDPTRVDLMTAAAVAYAAGRALGQKFWVLEMRPEGLPLTPLALEQYAPLPGGAR